MTIVLLIGVVAAGAGWVGWRLRALFDVAEMEEVRAERDDWRALAHKHNAQLRSLEAELALQEMTTNEKSALLGDSGPRRNMFSDNGRTH